MSTTAVSETDLTDIGQEPTAPAVAAGGRGRHAAKKKARGWLPGFIALGLIWGSSFLFIKVGVAELHPVHLTLYRVGIGALALVAILLITRDRLPRDLALYGHLFVVGGIGVALPFTLFGYGGERIDSTLSGLWNATTPLIVLPMAVLVFRTERLTREKALGLVLGFAGVLVLLGIWQGVEGSQLTGQLMCFVGASCYGFAIPYQKRFVAGGSQSGVSLAATQLLMATVQLAVVSAIFVGPPPALWTLSGQAIGSVLALGALGTGIAFILMFATIRRAGASTASMVTYLIPLVATALGVLVLGEQLSWYQPVGGLIVLAGVAVSQGKLARRRASPPVAESNPPDRDRSPLIASDACAFPDDDGPTHQRSELAQVGATSENPPARKASTKMA